MQKHGLSFWYAAAFMFGAIQLIALPLLIPSHILDVTGSMVHTGAALSFVGLSGFIAPLIGSTVDRLKLHSMAQKASLVFYAFAMALFAFVPTTWAMYLATFLVGLGSITLMTVNPTFIVAAGFDKTQEALRLTRMNQSIFVGAIVMGAILAIAEGISATLSFGIVGALSIIAMIIVSIDGKVAAQRIVSETPQQGESEEKGRWNLTFVTFLLAVFIAMLASSNQVAQGPNLFESLFNIDKSATALLLSISSVISLLTLDIAGRALGKFGAGKVWVVGLVGYIVVGTILSNLVTGSTEYFYLPLVMHLVFMQCLSMVDMVKPTIVAKVTTLSPAATQGFLLFAIAGGYAAGTALGGVVGEVAGMASLFTFIALSAAVALAFALFTLARIKD
jgi:predicted MFS family arabinose efflux permease